MAEGWGFILCTGLRATGEGVDGAAIEAQGLALVGSSPSSFKFRIGAPNPLGPADPSTWGLWSGDTWQSGSILDAIFSYEDDAADGRFVALGPICTATRLSTVALFVDDSNPVVACTGTFGAPNVHKLGFYGVPPVARAAHPANLADVITLLTNLGLCQ